MIVPLLTGVRKTHFGYDERHAQPMGDKPPREVEEKDMNHETQNIWHSFCTRTGFCDPFKWDRNTEYAMNGDCLPFGTALGTSMF